MNGLLRQSQLFLRKHGSTILTCIGGVGLIATTITAAKATPKAIKLIEQAEKEKREELTKFEKFKMAAPEYVPTAILGVSTLVCIFGANSLNKKQQAALVSAYTLVDTSYKRYKNKLVELYGKESHDKIVEELAIEKAEDININADTLGSNTSLTVDGFEGDTMLFYEEYSGRYFESTVERVMAAEYHLNRNFVLRGYAILNEFYIFLGLEPTDYGSEVAWCVEEELYWIDFNHRLVTLDDGLECCIIETPWHPNTDWKDYHYY